jgi:hypothetical protein
MAKRPREVSVEIPALDVQREVVSRAAADRATYIRRGQEAWMRHKTDCTWNDWLAIGDALDIGRTEAMAEARSNRPKGKGYNRAFSFWLFKHGFNDIDQGDRKRLFDILEHRGAIETWRATLMPIQRRRINHPSTVWRKWKAKPKAKRKSK